MESARMIDRKEDNKMTRLEFYALCTRLLIYPLVAIENENIKKALRERDDAKVEELLKTEF
jgi:hypothetical protein